MNLNSNYEIMNIIWCVNLVAGLLVQVIEMNNVECSTTTTTDRTMWNIKLLNYKTSPLSVCYYDIRHY